MAWTDYMPSFLRRNRAEASQEQPPPREQAVSESVPAAERQYQATARTLFPDPPTREGEKLDAGLDRAEQQAQDERERQRELLVQSIQNTARQLNHNPDDPELEQRFRDLVCKAEKDDHLCRFLEDYGIHNASVQYAYPRDFAHMDVHLRAWEHGDDQEHRPTTEPYKIVHMGEWCRRDSEREERSRSFIARSGEGWHAGMEVSNPFGGGEYERISGAFSSRNLAEKYGGLSWMWETCRQSPRLLIDDIQDAARALIERPRDKGLQAELGGLLQVALSTREVLEFLAGNGVDPPSIRRMDTAQIAELAADIGSERISPLRRVSSRS